MSVAIRAITRLQDADDVNVTPAVGVDEYALTYDHDTAKFVLRAPVAAPDLSGYALLAGRAGGQTLYGGTGANDDITIHGTSDATRTTSYVLLQPSGGNVGIGTVTPGDKLAVNGWIRAYAGSASDGGFSAYDAMTGGNHLFSLRRGIGTNNLSISSYDSIGFTGNATGGPSDLYQVFIKNDGGVGIGTTSPATALHVVGAATITAGIRPASDSTTALQLQNVAGTSILNVDTTNTRIGIGTTTPANKLEVSQDVTSAHFTGGVAQFHVTGTTDNTKSLMFGFETENNYGFIQTLDRGVSFSAYNLALMPKGGNVGIGTTAPVYQLQLWGAGQTTANLTDAGNKGGSLYLYDNGGAAGNGGAILFGAVNVGGTPQAAIKSLLTNGSAYGVGDLAFSTRNAVADTALTERMRILSTGNVGIGTSAPSTPLHVVSTTATTDALRNVLTLGSNVTGAGVGAAGLGAAVLFTMETSTTADTSAASVQAIIYEATHATRKFDLVLNAYDTAIREGLRIRGNGSAPAIGFLGATPQARIAHVADPAGGATVDAEARTAINSILSTLELFGLHATS